MELLPETRAALARYDAWIAGVLGSPRRLATGAGRTVRHLAWRLRNMVFGMLFVVFAAFLYGQLVAPIGFLGLLLMLFAMLAAALLLAGWPPRPALPAPGKAPLAVLSRRLVVFLEEARPAFPAAATGDLDVLLARLDELAPELRHIPRQSPEADDARRLLGEHLPRFVDSCRQLPEAARRDPEAAAHCRAGLVAVTAEVTRLAARIAAARLQALETEGRFLDSRYGDGQGTGGAT